MHHFFPNPAYTEVELTGYLHFFVGAGNCSTGLGFYTLCSMKNRTHFLGYMYHKTILQMYIYCIYMYLIIPNNDALYIFENLFFLVKLYIHENGFPLFMGHTVLSMKIHIHTHTAKL